MFIQEKLRKEMFKKEIVLCAYRTRRRQAEGKTVRMVEDVISFLNTEIEEFFTSLRPRVALADRDRGKGWTNDNLKDEYKRVLHDLKIELAELHEILKEDLAERAATRFGLGQNEFFYHLGQAYIAVDLWHEHYVDEFLAGAQVLLEDWASERDRSIFWAGQAEYWSNKVWGEMAHQLIPQALIAALAEQSGPGQKMAAYVGIDSSRQKAELKQGLAQRWDGALVALEQRLKKEATRRTAQALYSLHDQTIDRGLAAKMEFLEVKLNEEDLALLRREA